MEVTESESEIQEYSSSKEGESDMVKWILNKGYGIGKNIVISGILSSSASLVLPPLVVFSAMGVAFSIPFGLVFASYACTNKIMSKLLPIPTSPSPLMLKYYSDEDEQEKDTGFELYDYGDDFGQIEVDLANNFDQDVAGKGYYSDEFEDDEFRIEYLIQGDEEERIGVAEKTYYTDEDDEFRLENMVEDEQMEEVNQAVEILLELDDDDDDYLQFVGASITNADKNLGEKGCYNDENKEEKAEIDVMFGVGVGGDDYGQEREVLITNVDKNVVEEIYYTNENVIEKREREQMEDIKQGVEMRLELDGADKCKETDRGSITHFGGDVDDDSLEEERKVKTDRIVSQINENKSSAWEVTEVEEEEIVKDSTGILEKLRDEQRVDNCVEDEYLLGESGSNVVFDEIEVVKTSEPVVVKETDSQKLLKDGSKNDEPVGEMHHVVILARGNEENNFHSREIEELDLVAREVLGDTDKNGRKNKSEKKQEKIVKESIGSQEKTGGNTSVMTAMNEHLIHSNADAREIGDESGLDLFNERNTSMNFESLEAGDEAKQKAADDNVDVMALPDFKQSPLDADDAKIASKINKKMPSREDILNDEKIWEKIGAMRAIVGYNAPSQQTCIGELKALYVFTGVEPAASFKGDSDLDEVNTKLKFLMSIVGVK